MKKFKLKINTENDAFAEDPAYEIARILRELADRLEEKGLGKAQVGLWDINGNVVGQWETK